jgi:hypothetical protein
MIPGEVDVSSAHDKLKLISKFSTPRKCRVGLNIEITTHASSLPNEGMDYPYTTTARLIYENGKFYIKENGYAATLSRHIKRSLLPPRLEAFADGNISLASRYRSYSSLGGPPRTMTWKLTK